VAGATLEDLLRGVLISLHQCPFLLGIGNLILLYRPTIQLVGSRHLLHDVGAGVAIVVMAGVLISSTIRNIQVLYRAERPP
jgi:hypothetical protein